jgi:hypothetical protein
MRRDLCVVASRPMELRPDELDGDVLALSLPAMASLRNRNIHFLTPEDIYPRTSFESDAKEFSAAALNWLTACDQVCEAGLGVERAFSGNGFWFLHRLSDIHYLHSLSARIIGTGLVIRFVTSGEIKPLPQLQCDFGTLRFADVGVGLGHALTFLAAAIPAFSVRVDDLGGVFESPISAEPLMSLIRRAPEILVRRLKAWRPLQHRKGVAGQRYWIIQGGYDVDVLKDFWPDAEFVTVAPQLEADGMRAPGADISALEEDVRDLTEAFANRWLPAYSIWQRDWIAKYLRNVVARLPAVGQQQDQWLGAESPSAILYSIGAQTILESMVARTANRKGIPVFYFKHGGPETLFVQPSVFDQFFEHDPTIERVQFIHSLVEQDSFKGMTRVSTHVVGPLVRVAGQAHEKAHTSSRVLYSVGPPAHYTFKEMSKVITDAERFRFASALVESAAIVGVPLDIKVHPAEWRIGWDFFNELLLRKSSQKQNTRLIAGGAFERIIDRYGLLVVDIIPTRVLSHALSLDIPLIVYLPTEFNARYSTIRDLAQRAYLARSEEELHSLMSAFRHGDLPPLRSREFDERYLPLTQENAVNAVKAKIWNAQGLFQIL